VTVIAGPVYCLQCARPGTYAGESLLPGRPLVTCQWIGPDDKPHGHGRLPGTWDQAEAQALVDESRELRRRANHEAGRHLAQPVPSCPDCQRALYHKGHVKRNYRDPDCELCRARPEPRPALLPADPAEPPRSQRNRQIGGR
jgi:hypothetical protein